MYIYGYKANEKIEFRGIDIKEGDVFYIGVTKDPYSREKGHLNISNIDRQPVNELIQLNMDKYNVIDFSIYVDEKIRIPLNKKQAHKLELTLINMFNPQLNKYGKKDNL